MDYSYIYIENIELNKNAISNANNASHFNAGDVRAKDAENEFKKFAEQFPIHGELKVKQVEYLAHRQAQWAELVTTAYNDIICLCTSKIPAIGYAEQELMIYGKWHEKMECFLNKTQKKVEGMVSSATKRLLKKTA